jgi:molybdopterin-guanine dinucleotide biosynthesis protein A
MKAILCCAGDQRRWRNHLGVPKQLAPFGGVPLLKRTIDQLAARGVHDVAATAFDERFQAVGIPLCIPTTSILPGTGIGFSSGFWSTSERTLVLLGDVFFSEVAMDALVSAPDTAATWIGRNSSNATKPYGEIFAVSIPLACQQAMRDAAAKVFDLNRRNLISRMTGWELYGVLNGMDPTKPVTGPNWVNIDDESDDFDFPEEYEAWMRTHGARFAP